MKRIMDSESHLGLSPDIVLPLGLWDVHLPFLTVIFLAGHYTGPGDTGAAVTNQAGAPELPISQTS